MRIMWADFRNANRGKKKAVRPQDLIKLSFDDKKQEVIPMTTKEMKEMFGSKFKRSGN